MRPGLWSHVANLHSLTLRQRRVGKKCCPDHGLSGVLHPGCTRAMAYESTYCPSRKMSLRRVPSISKPNFLVKPDCRHVIDINGQFESLEIKPVIGRIGKRGHEDRPDAASMEIVMDGDTNIADMTLPPLVLQDAGGTDDAP